MKLMTVTRQLTKFQDCRQNHLCDFHLRSICLHYCLSWQSLWFPSQFYSPPSFSLLAVSVISISVLFASIIVSLGNLCDFHLSSIRLHHCLSWQSLWFPSQFYSPPSLSLLAISVISISILFASIIVSLGILCDFHLSSIRLLHCLSWQSLWFPSQFYSPP